MQCTWFTEFYYMLYGMQGLIKYVTKIFPDAEHRFCVRHLYQNFQKAGHKGEVLKNNLWAIARSTSIPKWQHNVDKMKASSQQAFQWIEELVPNTWIKAFFNDFPKCDMLLNNHSKVFTGYSSAIGVFIVILDNNIMKSINSNIAFVA